MAQKILFPMKYLNITTGVNELSHAGAPAIDIASKDTGIDSLAAPFTGIIKKKYPNGNTVWLESVDPVEFADGSIDYAVLEVTHDNDISDLYVGQRIEQGQSFYQEGTAGNATGNHVHMEIGKGRFTGTGWYQNAQGVWTINNGYSPWNAFYLSQDTIIINDKGYPWKRLGDEEVKIANTPEWRARMNKLHHQLVGNWDMSDDVFKSLIGGEFAYVVWSWSDHPNAAQLTHDQELGEKARIEDWASRPKEVVKEVPVPVEKIVEKEVIREVIIGDESRSPWDLISAGLSKLFNRR